MNYPLHWSVSGLIIGLIVPALLLISNRSFGISSVYTEFWALVFPRHLSKGNESNSWRLLFILGIFIGAFVVSSYQNIGQPINLAADTVTQLNSWGLAANDGYYPLEIFNFTNFKAMLLLAAGGLLVGFGTRMANGCTSGHCITGISNLQVHSIVVSICFFIGAMAMSYLILPHLLKIVLS